MGADGFLHASRLLGTGEPAGAAPGLLRSANAVERADIDGRFMFATGIECSNPRIDFGVTRRDLLEECGHYRHWKQDLGLVRELGLRFLRYGLPNHLVHLGPERYDWSFADPVMAEMQRLGIRPILDLMHFGVPDWIGDFQNPELPLHLHAYASAVSARYPWVRHYTPVNEIYVSARISAKDGLWNEQLTTDRGFVTALKHLAAASLLATEALVRNRPDAVIVHSESAEFIHQASLLPCAALALANKQRFISLDLLFGHPPCAEICMYLMDNGLTRSEYDWFMATAPAGHQVLGLDYYGRNEHVITPSGRRIPCEDVMGWHLIAREYFERYRIPLMHTETNVLDAEGAPAWLWKQWVNVLQMRRDRIPVLGFTWYSLTDQIDWDIALAEKRGRVNGCGLFNLQRDPNPVAAEYRALVQEFASLRGVPDSALFEGVQGVASPRSVAA